MERELEAEVEPDPRSTEVSFDESSSSINCSDCEACVDDLMYPDYKDFSECCHLWRKDDGAPRTSTPKPEVKEESWSSIPCIGDDWVYPPVLPNLDGNVLDALPDYSDEDSEIDMESEEESDISYSIDRTAFQSGTIDETFVNHILAEDESEVEEELEEDMDEWSIHETVETDSGYGSIPPMEDFEDVANVDEVEEPMDVQLYFQGVMDGNDIADCFNRRAELGSQTYVYFMPNGHPVFSLCPLTCPVIHDYE